MTPPRSINIFLLDGDPNGIRVAQISMSTIQAIAFRRNQLGRVRSTFGEIERPGVYVLLGADDADPDQVLAYIGESEGVGKRLATHNANDHGKDSKVFWNDTIVLISKDENLTKSHARYVEACLVREAGLNPRWVLPNSQHPSQDAGRLPLPDRAAMDEFVGQAKTLVGALGCDLFRATRGSLPDERVRTVPPTPSRTSEATFVCRGHGYAGEMTLSVSGEFIVVAGSRARAKTAPTMPRGTATLRRTLIDKGILRSEDDGLVFLSDYSFSSASAAAAAIMGSSANGRLLWKLPDGRSYGEWEVAQDEPGSSNRTSEEDVRRS